MTSCGGRSERTLENNGEGGTGGTGASQPGTGGIVDGSGVGGTSPADGGSGVATGGDTLGTGGASTGGREPGDGGTGGQAESGGAGGENNGSGGAPVVVMDGPCDIYEGAATRTCPTTGTLLDIPQAPDGFADASILEDNCSTAQNDGLPLCTVSLLYDQSGHGTDLPVARGGLANGGIYAEYHDFETVMDGSARLTVGGRTVYSLYMNVRNGYRIEEVGVGMPIDDEPQEIYMLADGTHTGGQCCFSFGNVPTHPASFGTPNSLFFGEAFWGKGANAPPWFGAEFDLGIWMGGSEEGDPGWGSILGTDWLPNEDNPSMAGVPFALGILKTNDDANTTYSLRMADVSAAGELTTAYEGPYPQLSNWVTIHNSGAVVLGVGIGNENNSFGTFYEGAIVAGFPNEATELAVLQNIQAVGYGQ